MSTPTSQRIVVRRKKNHRSTHHHGGSWKIAYADFITAMMAFFLVMWLLSIVPRDELVGIATYFRMPLKVAMMGGPKNSAETSAIPGGGRDPTRDDGERRRADGERLDAQTRADRRDRQRLEGLKKRLEALIQSNPVLRNYRPQLILDMTVEGLRIQIVDNQNRPMFATGRADVKPYMRDILREFGPVLNEMPNKISISGHTDAAQYARGEKAYSNWELSADRANASRQELVAGGMNEGKVLRVVGLSSSMSLVKDDEYAPVNRRISLVVLTQRMQRRLESENAAAAEFTVESAGQVGAVIADQVDGGSAPGSGPASESSGDRPGEPRASGASGASGASTAVPPPRGEK
jgi:chemotaxis protein MotB